MPLAMANALGVSLVILTSMSSSPVFFVGPRSHTSDILHLAYTSLGTGHYDGLVLKESNSQSVADATIYNYVDIVFITRKITLHVNHHGGRHSSCHCLAKGQGCSASCACGGCNNPNGKRPSARISKRSREPHTWQLVNTSNKSFALNSGQTLAQGV